MAIRITGGSLRGHQISGPSGRIRPTAARVRQVIFDILGDIVGLSFCDLYAGTGAVGIEAVSRGASYVEFVESDRRAARNIAATIDRLDLPSKTARIRPETVARWLSSAPATFDIIFADPPYLEGSANELARLLPQILKCLSPNGIFILQFPIKMVPPGGFSDERRFGDDMLYFWENGR